MCDNVNLRDETKIVSEKWLTHALAFLKVFKVEWINIVLSQVHDMKIWLEGGLVKINKAIIYQFTGYLTLDRLKIMRCAVKDIIEK